MAMLLSSRILEEREKGNIIIDPFFNRCLGNNSYDVHLGEWLGVYRSRTIDAKADNQVRFFKIPEEGFILSPRGFYLGSTIEYTETYGLVPFLEGKSSTGRLTISVHETAGKGDIGFRGFWTLEMTAKKRTRIYPRMPIGQIFYNTVEGDVSNTYDKKPDAKYSNQGPMPVPSKMYKNYGVDPLWRDHPLRGE